MLFSVCVQSIDKMSFTADNLHTKNCAELLSLCSSVYLSREWRLDIRDVINETKYLRPRSRPRPHLRPRSRPNLRGRGQIYRGRTEQCINGIFDLL